MTSNLFLLQNAATFKYLLNEWRIFTEKPPKGFEKYFEPGGKKPGKHAKTEGKPEAKEAKEAKDGKPKEESTEKPKIPPPPSKPPGQQQKPYDQWSFGLFGGTGSRGSGGKPFGESDKDKFYIFGAMGTIAIIGLFAYYEMGYKEIGWKEFVHT